MPFIWITNTVTNKGKWKRTRTERVRGRGKRLCLVSYLNLYGICIIRSYVFTGMVHTQMQTIIFEWNKQMTFSLFPKNILFLLLKNHILFAWYRVFVCIGFITWHSVGSFEKKKMRHESTLIVSKKTLVRRTVRIYTIVWICDENKTK